MYNSQLHFLNELTLRRLILCLEGFVMANKRVIPGFRLTISITLVYLTLIVLIPLLSLAIKGSGMGLDKFFLTILNPRVLHSFYVSFGCALLAAIINMIFGLILSWVLIRYNFPGKKILDGLIDLPFALPTAVAGIAFTALYSENGWVGRYLYTVGIESAFSLIGITIALVFIGIPFVVRSIQPVLKDLDFQYEEAAKVLGANSWTAFRRVILPELVPSILTGFALAFARGVGEYGSVVFIAGNMPFKTEIAPLIIMAKLEQYDYYGAVAVALVMLIASFVILFGINIWQWRINHTRGI